MADLTVGAETCVALGATEHQFESFPGRDIALGALTVTRVLPVKGRRLVGPWCFLDRFGPLTFADPSPMDVGAHPHMGLQTVTWLLDGELVHYDSLGFESLLRPGGVNVMTSGAAIAHAERTPTKNSGTATPMPRAELPRLRSTIARYARVSGGCEVQLTDVD
jgi:quercetin 2,3-dioxygenase